MYSSGGDFHLELPTGELEGPKDMWEISPFETKPVIRVRFNAKIENNYTAYVRYDFTKYLISYFVYCFLVFFYEFEMIMLSYLFFVVVSLNLDKVVYFYLKIKNALFANLYKFK